jgi:hypothetical protein
LRNSHCSHVVADVVCATEWLVAQMAGKMTSFSGGIKSFAGGIDRL